jgi:hypothetical protein
MPLEAKLDYASLYSAMKTFADLLNEEQTQWSILQSYQENEDLDRHELHEVRAAITSLKSDNDILNTFQIRPHELGRKLGISAEREVDESIRQEMVKFNEELCKPLL